MKCFFRLSLQAATPARLAARPDRWHRSAHLLHHRHRLYSGRHCAALLLWRGARTRHRLYKLRQGRNLRQVCWTHQVIAGYSMRMWNWLHTREGFSGKRLHILRSEQLLPEPSTLCQVAGWWTAARTTRQSVYGLSAFRIRRKRQNNCAVRCDRQFVVQWYAEHSQKVDAGDRAIVAHGHCVAVWSPDKVP